jgi:5'-3' exonuclease
MGIPAYFSHLIRNYGDVMISRKKVGRLYLDSNSIIYDVLRDIEKNGHPVNDLDLYRGICHKIEDYVKSISPSFVFIAFDGIPPMAKLEQQKTRRMKTTFERNMKEDSTQQGFNTVLITPGTPFMKELDKYVMGYFRNEHNLKDNVSVVFTGSSEPGEGEHKIFQHIRDNPPNENCAVYGLDADLIMLALNHLRMFKRTQQKGSPKLFLYREAPEFIQSLRGDFKPNQLYFLDIYALSKLISREMNDHDISNYIFMSFLLGNDFLPHFPILNIRTNGIARLMERFKEVKTKYPGFRFMDRNDTTERIEVIWTNVKMFLRPFAENEKELFLDELSNRDNMQRKRQAFWRHRKEDERKFQDIPILDRTRERMIEPKERGWEKRYWRILFGDKPFYTGGLQSNVIDNYCQGLEWVSQYYTYGTNNYVWYYQYNYPPLMKDLVENLPELESRLLEDDFTIMSNEFQLKHVIPNQYHELVGIKGTDNITRVDLSSFEWAFCRYFWESHLR